MARGITSLQFRLAGGCVLGMVFSIGSVIFGSLGLFLAPITREFGWTRAAFSGVFVLFAVLFALTSPFVGRAIDRWGALRVLLIGNGLFALANGALAFAGGSLVEFYLLFALISLTAAPASAVGYAKVISIAFNRRRGGVISITLGLGAVIGASLIPLFNLRMIELFGWREARVALAGLILVVLLPGLAFLLRDARGSANPMGTPQVVRDQTGVTAAEARRDPTFWLILVVLFIGLMCFGAMQVHTAPLLQDRGFPRSIGATILSVYGVATFVGQLTVGYFLDKVPTAKVGIPFFLSGLAGLLLIQYGEGVPMLLTGATILGLCFGAETILGAYYTSRYFGLVAYAEIYGLMYSAAVLGSGVGPLVMGGIYDASGSYTPMLIALEIGMVLCVICLALMRPYPETTVVVDEVAQLQAG